MHYSVSVMLNARLWDFSFLGWMLFNFLLAFICTNYDHYLCIQNPLNQFLPYESTIPTYMRYFRVVLGKFACAISNFQNKFLFCVLVPLARRWGVANIFHARCVILIMSLHSLVIAREYDKGIRDAQSWNENEFTLCCQIINFLKSVGMEGTRGYS